MSVHRHRAKPASAFSANQLRAVEAAARRAAESAPEHLREDAFAQGRLHGLLIISRDRAVSRERLTQLISRHIERWVAARLRTPSVISLSEMPDTAAPDSNPALRAAIQHIPLPFAAVAWRHIIDGAPLDVVAEEIGLALPFVRYLFRRALDMLVGASDIPGSGPAGDVTLAGELSEQTFAAEVRAELARARRRGYSVGLIILHGPGSAAAQRQAVEALLHNVRALDAVGWLDGTPAVLMPHLSAADAPAVAGRLAAAATAAAVLRWSAGWAVSPTDGRTLPALLSAAQARMTSARQVSAAGGASGVRASDDDRQRRAA